MVCVVSPGRRRGWAAAIVVLALVTGCSPGGTSSPPFASASAAESAVTSGTTPVGGSLVIVGRIVTMAEPPIAEALLIEDGIVTAVGSRDEVLARAGDRGAGRRHR